MAIEFFCPGCGKQMATPDEMAGRKGRCPSCSTKVRIPDQSLVGGGNTTAQQIDEQNRPVAAAAPTPKKKTQPQRPARSQSNAVTPGKINFHCSSCRKLVKVSAAAAGQQGRCPHCQGVITIPAASETASSVGLQPLAPSAGLTPLPADDGMKTVDLGLAPLDGGLMPLADSGLTPVDSGLTPLGPANDPLGPAPANDPLFDQSLAAGPAIPAYPTQPTSALPQPQYLAPKPAKPKKKKKKKQSSGAGGGTAMVLGILLSGVASLLGAAIWAAIAIGTGYEIGWIAWGVGLASGVGMQVGLHLSNDVDEGLGGIVAAGMAVGGILAGKAAVYMLVVIPAIKEVTGGVLPDEVTFAVMFSPIDALFFFLAIATAFRIGSGGGGG